MLAIARRFIDLLRRFRPRGRSRIRYSYNMGQYGVGGDGYWGMGGISVIIVTRYHIRYVRISENTGWMRVSYHYLLMLIVVVLPHTGQFISNG